MDGAQILALTAVVVSPAAALVGVWLSSSLSARQRQREREDAARSEALASLAHFMALLVDAAPVLVVAGDLREYATPEEAIAGLYQRWGTAREGMVLLSVSHPSSEVRKLAFDLQARTEMSLRLTDGAIKSGSDPDSSAHHESLAMAGRLGELLSPYARH